ncbi:MAG: anaerobic ribonucleoside-triphosphate reductase activating protein [Candidatus Omnitrophica bacterium]|nr:anaerobic ribonucleoside-triphosphate reductase activating protein [Candidatus Omnitrophota bacterium]MBU4479003.1 anaerobic ribonucleoside-triphosphate reductase activating protein [Candidatus Omnitrophota bacterium]MCG2703798.1 anaerobic ribonucleoside-triphosphate reductase activating protein [Candidatus Omnitrophota bacterium]
MGYPIKGFNPHTFIDCEGKLACVIYLSGCNFRCPYCHSKALVCESDNELGKVPFEQIELFLQEKEGWIDAVVIGGGEPTLYAQLPALLNDLKRNGLFVKIDTNGTNPQMLRHIIKEKLVDYVAMDVKAPLEPEKYHKASGSNIDLSLIKESIDIIMHSGIEYEFRTTVVPTLLDSADIVKIARLLRGAEKYVLQQFSPKDTLDISFMQVKPYTADELKKMRSLVKEFVKNCFVRGE